MQAYYREHIIVSSPICVHKAKIFYIREVTHMIMKILLADYVRDRTILIRLFFFPIAFTYAFIYILYSSVGELTTQEFLMSSFGKHFKS